MILLAFLIQTMEHLYILYIVLLIWHGVGNNWNDLIMLFHNLFEVHMAYIGVFSAENPQ